MQFFRFDLWKADEAYSLNAYYISHAKILHRLNLHSANTTLRRPLTLTDTQELDRLVTMPLRKIPSASFSLYDTVLCLFENLQEFIKTFFVMIRKLINIWRQTVALI